MLQTFSLNGHFSVRWMEKWIRPHPPQACPYNIRQAEVDPKGKANFIRNFLVKT